MAKIAIVGCGAMGSVYAALMVDAGHEVHAVTLWPDPKGTRAQQHGAREHVPERLLRGETQHDGGHGAAERERSGIQPGDVEGDEQGDQAGDQEKAPAPRRRPG